MTKFIRYGVTVILLLEVWKKTHWSNAISLLLIFICLEVIINHLRKIRAERSDRQKTEYRLFNKVKKQSRRLEEVSKSVDYVRSKLTGIQQPTKTKVVRDSFLDKDKD